MKVIILLSLLMAVSAKVGIFKLVNPRCGISADTFLTADNRFQNGTEIPRACEPLPTYPKKDNSPHNHDHTERIYQDMNLPEYVIELENAYMGGFEESVICGFLNSEYNEKVDSCAYDPYIETVYRVNIKKTTSLVKSDGKFAMVIGPSVLRTMSGEYSGKNMIFKEPFFGKWCADDLKATDEYFDNPNNRPCEIRYPNPFHYTGVETNERAYFPYLIAEIEDLTANVDSAMMVKFDDIPDRVAFSDAEPVAMGLQVKKKADDIIKEKGDEEVKKIEEQASLYDAQTLNKKFDDVSDTNTVLVSDVSALKTKVEALIWATCFIGAALGLLLMTLSALIIRSKTQTPGPGA